jgi:hypothetical protein
VDGIGQPWSNAVDKCRQYEGREISSPALCIGIQLFLVKRVGSVVLVSDQLVSVGPCLIIALQTYENLESLLSGTDRFIFNLCGVISELGGVKTPQLLSTKGRCNVV